jgi:hypothetical protein
MKRPQVSAASRRSLFLGTARFHKFCGHAASLERQMRKEPSRGRGHGRTVAGVIGLLTLLVRS